MGLPDENINSLPSGKDHFRNVYITPKTIRKVLLSKNTPEEKTTEPIVTSPLRSKIFNSELEELVQKVSEKKKKLQSAISQEISLIPTSEEYRFYLLSKVYSGKESAGSIRDYILEELKVFHISSFLVSYLDNQTGLFQPMIYSGISEKTFSNLYFHSQEPTMKASIPFLTFEDFKGKNPFLEKKFGNTELSAFQGISIEKVESPNCLVILFWKQNQYSTELGKQVSQAIQSFLDPIRSSLHHFFQKSIEVSQLQNDHSPYPKVLQYTKSQILNGNMNSIQIIKIQIKNYFDIENPTQLKDSILKSLDAILEPKELVLENNFNEIIFLSPNGATDKISKLLSKIEFKDFQFLITTSRYPDDESNIYLHF